MLASFGLAIAAHARLTTHGEVTAASAIGPDRQAEPSHGTASTGAIRPVLIDRAHNGMFYADVAINGQPMRFLIDTGATSVVLSRSDAAALGVDLGAAMPGRSVQTAAGKTPVDMVTLDTLEIAGRTLKDVEAAVVEHGVGAPLLGQSALAHLDLLAIRGDQMILN